MKLFWRCSMLITLLLCLLGCGGKDYFEHRKAVKIFEEHCKNAGLFIYEKVELGEEYFILAPESKKEMGAIPPGQVFEDRQLNMDKFLSDYEYTRHKRKYFYENGNLHYISSVVIRKSDNKTLGEAISVAGFGGGMTQRSHTKVCPNKKMTNGRIEHYYNHGMLPIHTFTRNI